MVTPDNGHSHDDDFASGLRFLQRRRALLRTPDERPENTEEKMERFQFVPVTVEDMEKRERERQTPENPPSTARKRMDPEKERGLNRRIQDLLEFAPERGVTTNQIADALEMNDTFEQHCTVYRILVRMEKTWWMGVERNGFHHSGRQGGPEVLWRRRRP
jgi:hypothetical protein